MRTRFLCVAMALSLLPMMGHGKGDEAQSKLMKKKLEAAQRILEGVATKNFDLIGKNAEDLIMISKEAAWKVDKAPKYEVFSNDFRRVADTLVKNAKDKNLDAAALTYVDLTLTCVKCHNYVREERRTDLGR